MTSPGSHDSTWIALVIAVAATFLMCQVFNFIVFKDAIVTSTNTSNLSLAPNGFFDMYPTDITPVRWIMMDSGTFYLIQIGWISHSLLNIFRVRHGEPIYKNPEIVSTIFLSMFILNMILNVILLLLSHHGYQVVSLALWALITMTLCVCLVDFCLRMHRNVKEMTTRYKLDLFLYRVFLQNGVSLYLTWCVIATLLTVTIILIYSWRISQTVACVISLSILCILFLVFVWLDLCYWERYVRYTFSTYLAVIWAMVGIILGDSTPFKPSTVLSAVTLVIVAMCFVIKVISTIINARRNPLTPPSDTSSIDEND